MYLNKALVYGNLTRDPEMRSLPSGVQVASFSLATNRVWKDKSGAKQESVDYHNIVVFGKQADIVGQYLKKGSAVLVEGRLQTRSWDGQDGVKRYRTEIVADRFQFGPRSAGAGGGGGGAPAAQSQKGQSAPPQDSADDGGGQIDYPEEDINPDDIPF